MVEKDVLLSRYSDECHSVADKYIERSTRFGAADITALKASAYNCCFDIKIQHSLEVISDVKSYQGIVKHAESEFSSADWALYQDQVEKQAKSELGRKETLADLVANVKSQSYAAIFGRTYIRTHPRRLFHVYTCGDCHGSGKITCHNCGGSGAVNCISCSGGGRVNCSCCHGSGRVSEQHQVRDYTGHYRSETRYRSCHHCSGGRVTCSSCGGSGRNTCRTCSGSGRVTCGTCAGHGYLTRVTSTDTYTVPKFSGHYPSGTPDYVHEALCKAGFPKLGQYGTIELDNINVLQEQAKADFKYRSTILFCELSLGISGHESSWVMFGSPPQIYDAGGILEVLLQDDFIRLDSLGTSWSRIRPWFYRLAREVITPFMASEVHQEIVNADYQGFETSVIMNKVNRSVSEAYIERSLSRLRQSIQIATRWSSIKWVVGISLFSIPFILASIIFFQRSETHTLLMTQEHLPLFPWMSGAEFPWLIAIISIPISFTGWFFAKWTSKKWIRRAGGKQLVDWASRKGLLMGKWTAVAAIILTASVSSIFFDKWPLWMDREGRLYGEVAFFQPPKIVESTGQHPLVNDSHKAKHKLNRNSEFSASSSQAVIDLSGRWEGTFFYPEGVEAQLTMNITSVSQKLSGNMSETDPRTNQPVNSTLSGSIDHNHKISFTQNFAPPYPVAKCHASYDAAARSISGICSAGEQSAKFIAKLM